MKFSTSLFSKRKRADSTALALASKRPNSRAQAQNILQDAEHIFLQPGLPTSVTHAAAASSSRLPSTSAEFAQVNSARQSGARTLKSAFRPRPPALQWSRDVPVAEYQFTRSTAQYQPSGDARIRKVSENLEVIAIAEDWLKGEERWQKKEP